MIQSTDRVPSNLNAPTSAPAVVQDNDDKRTRIIFSVGSWSGFMCGSGLILASVIMMSSLSPRSSSSRSATETINFTGNFRLESTFLSSPAASTSGSTGRHLGDEIQIGVAEVELHEIKPVAYVSALEARQTWSIGPEDAVNVARAPVEQPVSPSEVETADRPAVSTVVQPDVSVKPEIAVHLDSQSPRSIISQPADTTEPDVAKLEAPEVTSTEVSFEENADSFSLEQPKLITAEKRGGQEAEPSPAGSNPHRNR